MRVVIVGGGFGGVYCARALERSSRAFEVTLIDRRNYFLFYPLLVEAGIGELEPRHVVAPIRSFLTRTRFRMAEVKNVDLVGQEVILRDNERGTEERVGYDHLVLAPGSVTRLPDVPGLKEHGREMKSLGDAVALRDRAVALLESAAAEADPAARRSLLHFVVVGGNFTGVEVAGGYDHFLRKAIRRYPELTDRDHQVTIVEMQDRLLSVIDPDLADYARSHLESRGVSVRLKTTVSRIDSHQVTLDTGEKLDARTVIWCAGIAPSPLLGQLDLPKDKRGYLLCGEDFRVVNHDNIWSIGDAAVNPAPGGQTAAPTAQHAVKQGKHLAENLESVAAGRPTRPLAYHSLGSVAALGCRTGVAKVFGIRLSGFAAWWVFRTVYLMKMPGLARKLRIMLDWTLDLFFTTDPVQLGVHRRGD